jgi:hypothetical protein
LPVVARDAELAADHAGAADAAARADGRVVVGRVRDDRLARVRCAYRASAAFLKTVRLGTLRVPRCAPPPGTGRGGQGRAIGGAAEEREIAARVFEIPDVVSAIEDPFHARECAEAGLCRVAG